MQCLACRSLLLWKAFQLARSCGVRTVLQCRHAKSLRQCPSGTCHPKANQYRKAYSAAARQLSPSQRSFGQIHDRRLLLYAGVGPPCTGYWRRGKHPALRQDHDLPLLSRLPKHAHGAGSAAWSIVRSMASSVPSAFSTASSSARVRALYRLSRAPETGIGGAEGGCLKVNTSL
jgi:hypothetical protein